jgi:hypothetical protein
MRDLLEAILAFIGLVVIFLALAMFAIAFS